MVLIDPQGNHNCYHKELGQGLTCNQAKYAALITGLEIAKGKGVSDISIKGDSKLV